MRTRNPPPKKQLNISHLKLENKPKVASKLFAKAPSVLAAIVADEEALLQRYTQLQRYGPLTTTTISELKHDQTELSQRRQQLLSTLRSSRLAEARSRAEEDQCFQLLEAEVSKTQLESLHEKVLYNTTTRQFYAREVISPL